MVSTRVLVLGLVLVAALLPSRAEDVLFFGNSFTYGAMAPQVQRNGGVPALVQAIALAKGRQVTTTAVTAGGKNWSYLLALPGTESALSSKPWNWVVLQDFSTRPTSMGDVKSFMADGETFSDRIAKNSPHAGIVLYETWPRPAGAFYGSGAGSLTGPEQMLAELHENYGKLRDDLAAKDPSREVRLAPVGTAWGQVKARYPEINLDAIDHHHATADGYYLAALVIYETIFHDSAKGAPNEFFNGALVIPPADAGKLQEVTDAVSAGAAIPTAAK